MLYERLLEKLKEHKGEVENLVLQGQLEDFNNYRYLTGKIKGLQDALDICRETFRRSDND
jgi:hypothetical protein